MSITPVFDQTIAASEPDLWRASKIFPQFPLAQQVADGLGVPLMPGLVPDSPEWAVLDPRFYAKVTGVFPKPEPRWKTFLRCLLWWLP